MIRIKYSEKKKNNEKMKSVEKTLLQYGNI